jgi:chemotaxis protein histidine kinase CheA
MFNAPEFQALRREYVEGALGRCHYLAGEAERLLVGDPVDIVLLRHEVHRLRGSGGFYGFAAISEAAAATEDYLLAVIAGTVVLDRGGGALLLAVVAAVQAAKSEVNSPTTRAPGSQSPLGWPDP